MRKKIIGLDLGTNSIGWAYIERTSELGDGNIVDAGSRIIPMPQDAISKYETGNLQSSASVRTGYRSMRRLYERSELRRSRLLRVLNILGFLPQHYRDAIDFKVHLGQFKNHGEPLLPYKKDTNGKNTFIFTESFHEMLEDMRTYHPELLSNGRKIPYDWTIYYLRKKALSQPISKEELAWVILNFNTKRGYYQLRGKEEEIATNEHQFYDVLEVDSVEETGLNVKKKGYKWFKVHFTNGKVQNRTWKEAPCRVGDKVECIITYLVKKDGTPKMDENGEQLYKITAPDPTDWTLRKKRTESIITKGHVTVGEYIYDHLLVQPDDKIRGKYVHTIERKFYKEELRTILEKQKEFIPELRDKKLLLACISELYHNNYAHCSVLEKQDFTRLFVDDIIFYQRPLKSKKSLIADCPLEYYPFKDKDGIWKHRPIKCTPRSNPLFQTFRLWQFIQNLRIYRREEEHEGRLLLDVDVTGQFLSTPEDYCDLFDWLRAKSDITQKQLLAYPPFCLGKKAKDYRWNYVDDDKHAYPLCSTHHDISKAIKEVDDTLSLSAKEEKSLWHILYSVDDRYDLEKALRRFASKNGINEENFVNAFINFKPFDKSYASYSEKAIKKMLPLMSTGRYWNAEGIDAHTMQRISHIVNGEVDKSISNSVREKCAGLDRIEKYQFLPVWKVCYIIYNRHSEATDTIRWTTPDDIDTYLKKELRQGTLRNPVVESVLSEALRVVRDAWRQYGRPDEIHIEMGRDLKQNKAQRQKANTIMLNNQQTNLRIRCMLQEFADPDFHIANVRPQSPSQQELLKIYEQGVFDSIGEIPDDIQTIIDHIGNKNHGISKSDMLRYKLWLEQKYQSPYTGCPISLSRLFTSEYEIEHVIPQSRYFDDSLSNKVICETEVNRVKGTMLAHEFIKSKGGSIVKGTGGKQYKILDATQYEDFVKSHYVTNKSKMRHLMLDDIPDSFINKQINDTRYMARKALDIFSHLVREETNDDAAISKNVIACSGAITDRLKKDWGLNDVWNDIVSSRFQRMNDITHSSDYGQWVNKGGKRYFQINIPLEISKGFSKKRIDHRHHAMDAIIIACTTHSIVNYLNNASAAELGARHDLRSAVCFKDNNVDGSGSYRWTVKKPWQSFTQDTHSCLEHIVVSFKQNKRLITKVSNRYWHYRDGKKILDRQVKGDLLAIRKSLHKATVSGALYMPEMKRVSLKVALQDINSICDAKARKEIHHIINDLYNGHADNATLLKYFKARKYLLNGIDFSKLNVRVLPTQPNYSASRVALDSTFTEKDIEKVTDTGIQAILRRHLAHYVNERGEYDSTAAFSAEGIAVMNEHISELNNGKPHKPILKVRKKEAIGQKFNVGTVGSKNKKFVKADKGTNLFYAVYANADGIRSYESIPLNIAIERSKNRMDVSRATNDNGDKLLFVLSPGDLVYLPQDGEHVALPLDNSRIYKMVSCSETQCCFVPYYVANVICDKVEYGPHNKMERSLDGIMVKTRCVKLKVDRLGHISV